MMASPIKFALVGIFYGIALSVVGFLMTGAGHGTSLLLGVVAAPFSLLGVSFAIVTPPILWGVVGGLLSRADQTPRGIVVCLMLAHALGILLLPFVDDYADQKYFEKVWVYSPGIVLLGGSLYLVGQVAIWVCWWSRGWTRFNS